LKRVRGAVDIVLVLVSAAGHLPQDTAREAAFEIEPATEKNVADELHAAADRMNLLGFELAQFVG
jgi:hypothetical protein